MAEPNDHGVVVCMKGEDPAAVPDEVSARHGDIITFSAIDAHFKLHLPDIFTISMAPFKVHQNTHIKLEVRGDVAYGAYPYIVEKDLGDSFKKPPAKADPTIIIHNDA